MQARDCKAELQVRRQGSTPPGPCKLDSLGHTTGGAVCQLEHIAKQEPMAARSHISDTGNTKYLKPPDFSVSR